MKFSDKLTLSSTAVIAILFSTGATFMMVQNHDHLLQSYISRNMQTHDLESFSLESKLTQDATSNLTSFGSDEKAIRSRSMYYLQQVASHMNQPQTQYALLDTKHTVLYATGEKKLFLCTVFKHRVISSLSILPVFCYPCSCIYSYLRPGLSVYCII